MNERIKELAESTFVIGTDGDVSYVSQYMIEEFAKLIVLDCTDKIETYRIPVGNSAAGEIACELTYNALKRIRDDIKQHFGVE